MKDTLNTNAQAVLNAVRSTGDHPTALEVYEMVKQERPRIGLASIYRILHLLVEQDHIRELRLGDESCRYDARTERHDHAICKSCGILLDLPIDVRLSQQTLESAAHAAGIVLESYEIRLYGLCSSCRAAQNCTMASN